MATLKSAYFLYKSTEHNQKWESIHLLSIERYNLEFNITWASGIFLRIYTWTWQKRPQNIMGTSQATPRAATFSSTGQAKPGRTRRAKITQKSKSFSVFQTHQLPIILRNELTWQDKRGTRVGQVNSLSQTRLALQQTTLQEYLKDWAFREIIWIRRLWQARCACGHSQTAEDSYCALPFVIVTCQVMFSSLLHFASLSLPGLVKSLSMTSHARLADNTGCWSAPISPFTCSTAPHSWGRHRGVAVTYSKCNSNFQNEWFSTSYNYSSLGY